MLYGREHELELKEKFKTEMFSVDSHNWLYNGANAAHADLGYFIGYRICKAYYDHAAVKKEAIKAIIELNFTDEKQVGDFLNGSQYYPEGVNKAQLLAKYELLQPYITGITPDLKEERDISAGVKELTISFSAPMDKGISIAFGKGGKDHFPIKDVIGFSDDKRSIRLKVLLQPNQNYDFLITGRGFRSQAGYPLKDYSVSFKTGINP